MTTKSTKKTAGKAPSTEVTNPATDGVKVNTDGTREFKISDGRLVIIRAGKGRDSVMAMRVSAGVGEKYVGALMAQLCTVAGKKITMEDMEDLPLRDYTAIQTQFAEINF